MYKGPLSVPDPLNCSEAGRRRGLKYFLPGRSYDG